METRIKYVKKNNLWYYAVQAKKWIFWKTIETYATFESAERFLNILKGIDDFNGKAKSLNKIVYDGWAVRNVYKNTGIAYSINFFDSYPSKCKRYDKSEIIWEGVNSGTVPKMTITTTKLFSKDCLEPMKLRITIEQIEE